MIELDEKDVKAVGRSRFIRKHEKKLWIAILVGLGVFLCLTYLTYEIRNILQWIPIVPITGLFGFMIWYIKGLGKAEKEMVEVWKKVK